MATQNSSPNWYGAMQQFKWTVQNIRSKFDVPRPIAQSIQSTFPNWQQVCEIVEAQRALCSQVGH